jgi:uncharacterized protein YyaL (SSP411 family)
LAFGQWLWAYQALQGGITEVAIVGQPEDLQTQALLGEYNSGLRPAAVLAARPPAATTIVPILAEREPPAGAGAAAWVCRQSTCAAPVTDPDGLRALLDERGP